MKRKNVGLMLMVLSFLYFISAVWGSFQMGGVGGAAPISVVLILFIGGLPAGMISTGGNTLLMWTHGRKAGPYINGLHFSFGLGAFLAPTTR